MRGNRSIAHPLVAMQNVDLLTARRKRDDRRLDPRKLLLGRDDALRRLRIACVLMMTQSLLATPSTALTSHIIDAEVAGDAVDQAAWRLRPIGAPSGDDACESLLGDIRSSLRIAVETPSTISKKLRLIGTIHLFREDRIIVPGPVLELRCQRMFDSSPQC